MKVYQPLSMKLQLSNYNNQNGSRLFEKQTHFSSIVNIISLQISDFVCTKQTIRQYTTHNVVRLSFVITNRFYFSFCNRRLSSRAFKYFSSNHHWRKNFIILFCLCISNRISKELPKRTRIIIFSVVHVSDKRFRFLSRNVDKFDSILLW